GDTQVASGAQLTVSSIVQGTLSIGGAPPSGGGMASAAAPVPEPGTWILLVIFAILSAARLCKKRLLS
ncbi:MAG: PEP-CTERM sorting domain-containing protein, partial [Pirellulales bacterium]|nr:PEP-CTERM sorting domain-containing protein [Pirellulales bacterium]